MKTTLETAHLVQEKIRELNKSLTIKEIAKLLELSYAHVWNLINFDSSRMSYKLLERACARFGLECPARKTRRRTKGRPPKFYYQ